MDVQTKAWRTVLRYGRGDGGTPESGLELARRILQHPRCDPNILVDYGWTPLHRCAMSGDAFVDIARTILEHPKCDPNVRAYGRTPLHHCVCQNGDRSLEIARLILQHPRSEPNQGDMDGWTPLHCGAMYKWRIGALRILLQDPRCDPAFTDKNGWTPLHFWTSNVYDGSLETAALILRRGGGQALRARNKGGGTPLQVARAVGNGRQAQYLQRVEVLLILCSARATKMRVPFATIPLELIRAMADFLILV